MKSITHSHPGRPRQVAALFLLLISSFIFQQGCGVYSFTGASISPEVKSVSIAFFPSYAALAPANMPQLFTEELRDKFVNQTSLDLITSNGDIRFEGFISDYRTTPVAIQGDAAGQNRLTITVNVTYTDTKNEENSFEKSFSRFADFPVIVNLSDVEQGLIGEINEQIIQDIFNASVVNW
jgi:hypothetical protein